ncbi:MAG TPA: tetratricopeptide repeat protein, partial [Coleofasciculaceae cyanobacterium]
MPMDKWSWFPKRLKLRPGLYQQIAGIPNVKRTIPRLVKSIHYTFWLGLLTLFVVITVVPGKQAMLASERTTHAAGSLHLQPQPLLPITQGEQDFKVPLPQGEGFRVRAFYDDIRPFSIAAVNQSPVEASAQLEQGRTLYIVGRFSEAVTLWKQAANNYKSQGDHINQALSLSYLSLAYQDLGQWQNAQQAITQSLDLITSNPDNPLILAQALNTQASLQLAMGQPEAALETWKQAEDAYKAAGDEAGVMGSQINQAQALQTLGFYRRAQTLLEQVNQRLQAQADSLLKATGLQSLGVALQVAGDLEQSQTVLKQSLAITQQLDASADTSPILFSLGNTARALQQYDTALSYYQKVTEKATLGITKVEAQLNQLSLLIETQQWQAAQALLPQIQSQLTTLPPNRASVYAQVNLAESLMRMVREKSQNQVALSQPGEIAQILTKALQQARLLQDSRAESYSLGKLGELYAQTQQWSDAQKLTQEALSLAQAMSADNIAYRWQWQLGRILKEQGELRGAIAAYNEAVKTLQSLRSDLVAVNPDVQFSFRDSVEPVYRELVQLLVQSEPNQSDLETARKVIESLQLAELDNFFREACLKAQPEQIDKIDPTAAVIYPIILSDRLAVILSLPGQPLRYYQTQLPDTEIEGTLEQLLQSFNPAISNKQRLRLSQKLYDWLLRPAETSLTASGIKTLVFVLDGSLRNIPMAALYDGQHY